MVWRPSALWFWHRLPARSEEVFDLLNPSYYTHPQFTCACDLKQVEAETFGVVGTKKGSALTDPDPNAPSPHERERSYESLYPQHP